MRKYYHTISYFVINEDGRNTIVIPRSDGPDKQFMLTIESENEDLNAYLGQWPGWDISEEQFYRELRDERERLASSLCLVKEDRASTTFLNYALKHKSLLV